MPTSHTLTSHIASDFPPPRAIAITGASSGLGAALAEHYAAPGVTLYLSGRDAARLAAVQERCAARGATAHATTLDVTNASATADWLEQADNATPLDLVIANAGISAGSGDAGESAAQAEAIFATNVNGVLHTLHPMIPRMTARKSGQLAIISSIAGLRGLPSAPAYSASKAAVRAYGEALRGALGKEGVRVSVVCPGYVRTPMTAKNPFPMPFLMDADEAARRIARGLAQNRSRIAFPWPTYTAMVVMSCLPTWLTDPLFARLPSKPATR